MVLTKWVTCLTRDNSKSFARFRGVVENKSENEEV